MRLLKTGSLILDRFTLKQQLRTGLWTASDRELRVDTLIEVYETDNIASDTLRDSVRKFREVTHPNIAPVYDLHHDADLTVIPISAKGDQTLTEHLKQTGPLPYREALDKVRPVIDALRSLHDHGIIHGGIHPDNIVTDETGIWQLLLDRRCEENPPSEMQQLGDLLATVLLGGQLLEQGEELNNLPDKLFGGRTIPAMLNQLVNDLRSNSPTQRPAGMGETLNLLDQIERLVENVPSAEPTLPSLTRPATQTRSAKLQSHKSDKVHAAFIFIGILFAMMALGAFGLWWFVKVENRKADAEEQRRLRASATSVKEVPPTRGDLNNTNTPPLALLEPDESIIQQAMLKAEAEEALEGYMKAKQSAEGAGAHKWARQEFATAFRAAAIADQAFIDKQYGKSIEYYKNSAKQLTDLAEGKNAALERLLEEGVLQLINGTQAEAIEIYEMALLIDPNNTEAREGAGRAQNLDKRNDLLRSAEKHEQNKRFAFAYTDYEEAVKLDPDSERAIEGAARLKATISEDRFQTMMSAGLTAFHKGDYELATSSLNEAKAFQPNRSEVEAALEMVNEGIRLQKIEGHKQSAVALEDKEDWQNARLEYLAVLEIDSNIQFANEGRSRTEDRITLQAKLNKYNEKPHLLLNATGLQDAQLAVSEALEIAHKGAVLQKATDILQRAVIRASTEVTVTLSSDGKTSVDIYKVGQLGAFEVKKLALLPGTYTILGHRNGYRDVRTQLDIEPGQTEAKLSVTCTERF